jgi:hypothetical protein
MSTDHIDLNHFIVDRLDASYLWIERLRDGVTDEQFTINLRMIPIRSPG